METTIGYTELSEETTEYLKANFELFELIDAEDSRENAQFAFAEIDGVIVGVAQYIGNEIHLIQSKPGTGAGAAIVDALKEEFGTDGLRAENALAGAVAWYESQGFEKQGRTAEGWDMIWYPADEE